MVSPSPSSRTSNKSLRSENNPDTQVVATKDPVNTSQKSARAWSVWGNDKAAADATAQSESKMHPNGDTKDTSTVERSNKSVGSKVSVSSLIVPNQKTGINEAPGNAPSQKRDNVIQDEQGLSNAKDDDTKKGWFFWNRSSVVSEQTEGNDVEQVVSSSRSTNLLTNTIIPYSSSDAILFKSKSGTELLNDATLPNADKQSPNIVVPSFEILPHQTAFNFISSSINKLAHRWHLLSGQYMGEKCLYQKGPQANLQELSHGESKPIKVLIVGVHGFFPTKMIRPFIGEPTGTSIKFISEAEDVVLKYFQKYKRTVEISKIALEREGEVLERVDFFFEVMKNWAKEINQADFIYFVAHSQGCPVTILLLARLIDIGLINLDNTRFFNEDDIPFSTSKKIISILAMAGINNGPFYGADQTLFVRAYQTIEKESLRELFQFQNFDSSLSRQLIRSIRIIIGSGVKITFVGSINDQLVPLYSSICLFAHHPNIFRATFIDKGSRTPAFIMRLVNIAGTLLDLGYDDHGIIKEVSASLAGTLTGGGHSTVYNEAAVYELGLKFALETSDVPSEVPVEFKPFKLEQLGANPYHLPWCMRGLIYETSRHLDEEEIQKLFKEFENWEPETKQLKDIKYRLNGLKSKL